MKGYKATKNMKCETLTYEVGKTYKIDNIEMCSHGFHFCEKMGDVLYYYPYNKDFVLLEVEILGDNIISEGNKSVTDHIKILRVVPKEEYDFEIPLMEYDINGNLIHKKDNMGYECWWEFDSNNNLIHYKTSKGVEYWQEYDSNNNLIHYKDLRGYEYWQEYDSNNNLIHYKDTDGHEGRYEYDSNNNLIYHKNTNGKNWRITIS